MGYWLPDSICTIPIINLVFILHITMKTNSCKYFKTDRIKFQLFIVS